MNNTIAWITRTILTASLLVIVWLNSHWSVALAVTLLAVSNEVNNHLLMKTIEAVHIITEHICSLVRN